MFVLPDRLHGDGYRSVWAADAVDAQGNTYWTKTAGMTIREFVKK